MTDGFGLILLIHLTFCFMRNWGGILSWCVPNLPYLTKKVLCFPFAWACCQLGWLAGELVASTPGDAPLKKV